MWTTRPELSGLRYAKRLPGSDSEGVLRFVEMEEGMLRVGFEGSVDDVERVGYRRASFLSSLLDRMRSRTTSKSRAEEGADLMLFASLGESRVERRTFTGYEIDGAADHYALDLGLRLFDVASQRVIHADSLEARHQELYRRADAAPREAAERGPTLVRKLVAEAEEALAAGLGARP